MTDSDCLEAILDVLRQINDRIHEQRSPAGFDPEQQAMVYVKGIALDLQRAGDALLIAAEALKAAGKGHPASLAHQAYKAAHARAHEVLGG